MNLILFNTGPILSLVYLKLKSNYHISP